MCGCFSVEGVREWWWCSPEFLINNDEKSFIDMLKSRKKANVEGLGQSNGDSKMGKKKGSPALLGFFKVTTSNRLLRMGEGYQISTFLGFLLIVVTVPV